MAPTDEKWWLLVPRIILSDRVTGMFPTDGPRLEGNRGGKTEKFGQMRAAACRP